MIPGLVNTWHVTVGLSRTPWANAFAELLYDIAALGDNRMSFMQQLRDLPLFLSRVMTGIGLIQVLYVATWTALVTAN
jgi:hypothetical protein